MAPSRLPRELLEQVLTAVNNAIRAGYRTGGIPSAITKAAEALGLEPYMVRDRLRMLERRYGMVPDPDPTDYSAPEFQPVAKPRVIVRAASSARPEGEAIRITVFGDTHCAPGQDAERFKWFARHVGETRPHKVVQIGDIGEFASLERHSPLGSLQQKARPKFQDDLASVEEALALYRNELGDVGIHHHITLGNHEQRILTFEGLTAEVEGTMWPQFTDVLARYDWRWTDYRGYLFIGGVGFTHVPQSLREQPYNGKTLQPVANDLCWSLVWGHTHRLAYLSVPKLGPAQSVQVLNVGSAMPHGYFPPYNVSEQGAYTWGIVDCTLQGGHITSHRFIPMTELEARYS